MFIGRSESDEKNKIEPQVEPETIESVSGFRSYSIGF